MGNMSDVLLRVGRLNYVWTNTESLLIYVIAHLLAVDKETAIIVFLTLNTTRARIDLVERLAKRRSTDPTERAAILADMSRLKKEAKVRNKYNHSIYSFDERGDISSTQLMRLVETDEEIRYGKVEQMDAKEMQQLERAIAEITDISKSLWRFIHASTHLESEI
ncbi:hypothetical protein HHL25_21580 [Rhizobium sp. S-51]|uniref:Uncharacterized protein n=1 Tax=Rhizobium terricola TaxID=2728849 RepID=A0A7Y0B069_9HYPH|nr:hypothetical protein [Rhizobium terricola]NML76734.1 hypothetical protein [Rhizobium terricola]